MNIYPVLFLIIFFGFRYIWSFVGGKRKNKTVKFDITFPRKIFEIFVYLLFPILLSFNLIPVLVITSNIILGKTFFIMGILFSILGLSIMIWARASRKRDWGLMGDESADKLVKAGAYSVSRHPYYVGAIFFITGLYLQLNSLWVILVIPVILFIFKVIKKEDSELLKKFGNDFIDYKKQVGVIPWLKI